MKVQIGCLRCVILCVVVSGLQGCDQFEEQDDASTFEIASDQVKDFVNGVKDDLVFVEGGKYLMGDYGAQYGPEKLPYDRDYDSKPVHEVELSNFSIGRFKVTNLEYQFYLKANGLKLRETGMARRQEWDDINSEARTPAHVDWFEANSYCAWLKEISGLPFAQATEAQWEYAARSRGQFIMVATNDGTYQAEPRSRRTSTYNPKGINISTRGDRIAYAKSKGWKVGPYGPLPVDMFPPNSLGLYAMSDNGYEWVSDWYDPGYYAKSPEVNPQGPDNPVHKNSFGQFTKVMRGQGVANPYWGGGVNVDRIPQDPLGRIDDEGLIFLGNKTARCVVNSPEPISLQDG